MFGAALFCLGCGSKGAVALTATIANARVSVEAGALGTRLAGRFDLVLEVGSEASDSTSVTLETFGLERGPTVLKSPIDVAPDGNVTFPVTVGIGARREIPFTLEDLADITEVEAICGGRLRVVGVIRDTLGGDKPTGITSVEISPGGC